MVVQRRYTRSFGTLAFSLVMNIYSLIYPVLFAPTVRFSNAKTFFHLSLFHIRSTLDKVINFFCNSLRFPCMDIVSDIQK